MVTNDLRGEGIMSCIKNQIRKYLRNYLVNKISVTIDGRTSCKPWRVTWLMFIGSGWNLAIRKKNCKLILRMSSLRFRFYQMSSILWSHNHSHYHHLPGWASNLALSVLGSDCKCQVEVYSVSAISSPASAQLSRRCSVILNVDDPVVGCQDWWRADYKSICCTVLGPLLRETTKGKSSIEVIIAR